MCLKHVIFKYIKLVLVIGISYYWYVVNTYFDIVGMLIPLAALKENIFELLISTKQSSLYSN